MFHRATTLALLLLAACGGRVEDAPNAVAGQSLPGVTSDPVSAALFVGTWSCQDLLSEFITSSQSSQAQAQWNTEEVVTFALNPDSTLTMTFITTKLGVSHMDDAGVNAWSPYTFTAEGSTATAVRGQTISNGQATLSFRSASFVISGSQASFNVTTTVAADPGSNVEPGTDTLVGTCSKSP